MGSMALADLVGMTRRVGPGGNLGGFHPCKDLEVLAVIVRHKSIGHIFLIYLDLLDMYKKSAFWLGFFGEKGRNFIHNIGRSRYD